MIEKIGVAGIYDILEEDYHADPCSTPSLSASLISVILDKTVADAAFKHPRLNLALETKGPKDTQYDLGNVYHTLVTGVGPEIEIIDAKNWQTNSAKDDRLLAIAQNKQPCLPDVYAAAEAMAKALHAHLKQDPDNSRAFDARYGKGEVTAIAQLPSPNGPVMCRARADWLQDNGDGTYVIYDAKSWQSGCDPSEFAKYIYRESRDVQDPFYTLVFAQALGVGVEAITFRYVLQAANEPHHVTIDQLDDQAQSFSFERVHYALEKWGDAMRKGHFPAYPPRTHYMAVPPYELVKWAEKIAAEEFVEQLDQRAAETETKE